MKLQADMINWDFVKWNFKQIWSIGIYSDQSPKERNQRQSINPKKNSMRATKDEQRKS